MPAVLCLAGFGDDASMFAGLLRTPLATEWHLVPTDLPGFGAPTAAGGTSLRSLAAFVLERAIDEGAEIVLAHSLASVVASIAAGMPTSPISRIFSLEGNLTAEDAYFSGTAADFDSPEAFRSAFLARLAERREDRTIARYRSVVANADPVALWQLGTDARRFSDEQVPGDVLTSSARATYVYNPSNCPEATLAWLSESPMERIVLEGASHWVSVDQPERLSEALLHTRSGRARIATASPPLPKAPS